MFSPEHQDLVRAAYATWGTLGAKDVESGRQALYGGWYAAARSAALVPKPALGEPPLVGQLRLAHHGGRRWVPGVPVIALGLAGAVVVSLPDGGVRALSRGDFIGERPGLPTREGDLVTVVDRAGGYEVEGWWRTWGGDWDPTSPSPDVTRIYVGADPARIQEIVARLTAALADVPFGWSLKVASQAEFLVRPDPCLLYVKDEDRAQALSIVREAAHGRVLDGRVPFTAPVERGISWAEDPGGDRSFGETRCAALAEAFLTSPTDPVSAADEAFRAAGLTPSAPHLRGAPR